MLGGNSQDDGNMEDSKSSMGAQNGPSDMIKACIREEIREYFSSIENKFAKNDEKMEEIKKKVGGIEKKMEEHLQIAKSGQETMAAILEMMQCQATKAASFQNHEHRASGGDARPSVSAKATGFLNSAKSLIQWAPLMCAVRQQRERIGKTETPHSHPPSSMSVTRGITTVTTVNRGSTPSNQVSNAITTPTFTCQQPRTQPHSASNLEMSREVFRRSPGQSSVSQDQLVPSNISCDALLGLAIEMFRQTPSTENRQLNLLLEDYNINQITTAVAQVNKEGHQIAAKTRYVGDQTVPRSSAFDQSLGFQHLPLQITTDGLRAPCSGTNLTEKVMLQLSRMIGHNWKIIGIECLGFKADYLSTIEVQHKDVHTQIFYMIRQWSRENGADGTIEKLSELLKESRDIDYDVFAYLDSLVKPPESTG